MLASDDARVALERAESAEQVVISQQQTVISQQQTIAEKDALLSQMQSALDAQVRQNQQLTFLQPKEIDVQYKQQFAAVPKFLLARNRRCQRASNIENFVRCASV